MASYRDHQESIGRQGQEPAERNDPREKIGQLGSVYANSLLENRDSLPSPRETF